MSNYGVHIENNGSNFETARDYKSDLGSIIGRPLDPENIDSYAEDALSDLIVLVNDSTNSYNLQPTINFSRGKELEEAVFSYYDLGFIELILDHVAAIDDEIKRLDDVIERAKTVDSVTVPTNIEGIEIITGNGTFIEKSVISRTKATLFILANDFEIDVHDPEQLQITSGILSDNMMRKLSYTLIEVPKLSRTILTCDEEGNVSYVIDTNELEKFDITPEDLIKLTKQDLNDLLQDKPEFGKRLVYSKKFVGNMVKLIKDPQIKLNGNGSDQDKEGTYLIPKAPEDVLSANGIAKKIGTDRAVVARAVHEIGARLGESQQFIFRHTITYGYTPEQQDIIYQYLVQKGLFEDKAPEGTLCVSGIARDLGVGETTVNNAISEIKANIGETELYRFGPQVTTGYTPRQQEAIRQYLEINDMLVEKAPEDILSLSGMKKVWGLDHETISKIVKEIEADLGDTNKYLFGNHITTGYTPEQQEIIRQHLDTRGFFCEKAPEGILSANSVADIFNIAYGTMNSLLKELGEVLGDTNKYRYYNRIAIGYTPEQQEIIHQHLEARGLFTKENPEGILSIHGIVDALGVGYPIVYKAIDELKESLGQTHDYKFGNVRIATGYTLKQQEIIRQHLEANGLLVEKAPEEILSAQGIANHLGISRNAIAKAILEIGATIGKVRKYKFLGHITTGYTPEQQEIIRQNIEAKGLLTEKAPEGVLSASALARLLDIDKNIIFKVIIKLGDSLGVVNQYKFGSAVALGYTIEQQIIIKQNI